jgi:hypothetical protein
MEEQREEQQDDTAASVWHLTREQVALAGGTMLASTGVDLLAHLGATGLVVGGILAFAAARHGQGLYRQMQGLLSPAPRPAPTPPHSHPGKQSKRSVLDRALGRFPDALEAEEEEPLPLEEEQQDTRVAEGDLLHERQQAPQGGMPLPRRLTLDEIVAHTPRNSYKLYIGRSLTRPGHPAILVSFYQRHFKFIGASQTGKSSMVAAFLEMVMRTHDTGHVLIVLLDLEDRTANLFATSDHLAEVCIDGQWVPLHARSPEQVLEYLGYVVQVVRMRYELAKEDLQRLLQEPIILVYLEEFIELKDYFKTRADAAPTREEKEQARHDYANLIYRIKTIARLGLKARVQLLLCAQVNYRDEDLQEALINVTAGMAFSVLVTAAQAAGFYDAGLLARNAKEDQVGQAVAQMPGCKDLVLAPEYPLEQKLLAFEQAERAAGRERPRNVREQNQALRPAGEHRSMPPDPFAALMEAGLVQQAAGAEAHTVLPFSQLTRDHMVTVPALPIPVLPEKGPRAEDIDLAIAVDLWNKGYNSERKLMKVFRMTLYQAGRLRDMILAQGTAGTAGRVEAE